MEENTKLIESLLEKAGEYGKTSLELLKLKALDKTTEVVSSVITNSIIFVLFGGCLIFLNIGLALWLGELLGKIFYGFFAMAAINGLIALILRVFMSKWLKKVFSNMIIKQLLN